MARCLRRRARLEGSGEVQAACLALVLALVLAPGVSSAFASDGWIEVLSPHFHV